MLLGLSVLTAIRIAFRAHLESRVWRDFFDGLFAIGSLLLAMFYGAALGNLVVGLPLPRRGCRKHPLDVPVRQKRQCPACIPRVCALLDRNVVGSGIRTVSGDAAVHDEC